MKKNLFFGAIMATVVMTGCSKNEVHYLESNSSLDDIEFASVIGKQTRATEMNTNGLKVASEVKMYNYSTVEAFDAASAFAKYFDNDPESLNYTAQRGWKTSKDYKWSQLGANNLSIISIHPALANPVDYTGPTASTAPKFAYMVQEDPRNQQDLIVSASLNLTKDNTLGKINLRFKHILSQVLFKAKTDDVSFRIKIKKLEVVGAKNAADFTFLKTAPVQSSGPIGSWDNLSGDAAYTYVDGGTAFYDNTGDDVIGDGGVLMILPQTEATAFKFKITYDVVDALIDTEILATDIVKEAEMVTKEMGKKYVYTLIIPNEDADLIRFSVDVDEWEVPVIEHERKFEVLTLNATTIADKAKAYAATMGGKKSYIHTVQVNGAATAATTIDLSALGTDPASGSKIVLDFTQVTGVSVTNTISVTAPAAGWLLSPAQALDAAGIITLTRN